jgi:hypothetical protein
VVRVAIVKMVDPNFTMAMVNIRNFRGQSGQFDDDHLKNSKISVVKMVNINFTITIYGVTNLQML